MNIQNPQKIKEALEHYKRADNVSDWIVLGYTSPTTVELVATGSGGAATLSKQLDDSKVLYILVKEEYDESDPGFKEGVIGNKANSKDIFIAWTGPKVGIIEKGKKKSHVGDAKACFQPFHAELTAVNSAHFNDRVIKDKANPLSGSHIID
ncbi:hypothetical protein PPL_01791 [Heterostelium album PN500]|uniref:ADF-H domain-containing protein n=1 Tax=Heterostelium pallidum (strain ATCC 26659 / Pp 5 / PN500) TaxID=670386 RepID=D3B0H4_HETP5|nr:hypothetical protein PPL_01791 [Heterostelium album PN500]EFA84798.1 hypothetical protein PPL_01791 [Heterostelium album PN500]|eukprot:XP_020436909.1 hypothetical protein PPL_01791 [Heterostelium album PN500]